LNEEEEEEVRQAGRQARQARQAADGSVGRSVGRSGVGYVHQRKCIVLALVLNCYEYGIIPKQLACCLLLTGGEEGNGVFAKGFWNG